MPRKICFRLRSISIKVPRKDLKVHHLYKPSERWFRKSLSEAVSNHIFCRYLLDVDKLVIVRFLYLEILVHNVRRGAGKMVSRNVSDGVLIVVVGEQRSIWMAVA